MSRKGFAAQGLTHPRVTFEPVAGTASTWYTGTVYTNPAHDPRRADDPGDLGVVVLDRPEKLPLLLLTVPGSGHFLQREQPQAVTELVLDWFARQ
jgi:hypothetical protein